MEQIFQAAADVHANANQMVKCLIDLGLGVWGRLSETQRHQVLKGTALRYCDGRILRTLRIARKLEFAQREIELNDRLGLALPAETKRSIRRLATRTRTSMSEVVREKLRT
jgi:isopropylmalate/homocitrate/citramalate synthase